MKLENFWFKPGQLVDRQIICQIKVEKGKAAGLDVHHFGEECNSIQDYLEQSYFPLAPKNAQEPYDAAFAELKSIHERLWGLEDKIRDLRKRHEAHRLVPEEFEQVAEISFMIATYNDRRSAIISRINSLFGITPLLEKMYNAGA